MIVLLLQYSQRFTRNGLFRDLHKRYITNAPIKKVLIANRGEIACRVARTAKRMGIKVVAVYSDADKNAMHVSVADEAYNIGPAASTESYLRGDKLISVAQLSGCQAIHPGYGFLSENAEFAEKCIQNGIIFIGPPASAIRDMGCKSTSKKIMEAASVPVVKGYHGDNQSDEKLKEEAGKIGYPVMLKALKGGGGKGMRVVMKQEDFKEQLASARNEASKAFGDTAMLVESFVSNPRHVEVQVFGDTLGNYVHLHERDCSVQRRHQKIIEEAPAPGLPNKVRISLGDAAVKAARAVGYFGAGTVEFILDASSYQYFFMEMNTRLQVEHPVTEMITGTDLVEWQFKVAGGEKLPLTQEEIPAKGHAFEARVYAEDPDNGFLPQAGTLSHLSLPTDDINVRVDTGVRSGDPVSVFYDPLIAKLVVWGSDRAEALRRLRTSLASFQVSGVPTNINFLLSLAGHAEFQAGNVHTNFIPEHGEQLLCSPNIDRRVWATAIAAQLFREVHDSKSNDIFQSHPGWRVNHQLKRTLKLTWKGEEIPIEVEYLPEGLKRVIILSKGEEFILSSKCEEGANGALVIETNIDGHIDRMNVIIAKDNIQVFTAQGVRTLTIPQPKWKKQLGDDTESAGNNKQAESPMPGVIDQVMVTPGLTVTKGQPLLTVIAMKMEYVIRAPADGIIKELIHKSGDAVAKGAVLVRFEEEPACLA